MRRSEHRTDGRGRRRPVCATCRKPFRGDDTLVRVHGVWLHLGCWWPRYLEKQRRAA